MKKQNFFKKAYLYGALFIALTAVLAMILYHNLSWIGVIFFVELLCAQVMTRQLVALQMRYSESCKKLYPYAATFTVISFTVLALTGVLAYSGQEDFDGSRIVVLAVHVLIVLLFSALYLFMTKKDKKKSDVLVRMSKNEIDAELYKIRRALHEIECAQRILEQSPLY